MNYKEIDNYLKKSLEDRIKKSTNDKIFYIHFLNKIENHTTHKYKFLHYLDKISDYGEMCNQEDNFLICCYNEYMYKYRNNLLKKNNKRLLNETIKIIEKSSITPSFPVAKMSRPTSPIVDNKVTEFLGSLRIFSFGKKKS
tara:strand:- start:108 stop:530 length:423 start_codon:yes stop_codon:yes gene_type:complete